MDLENLLANRQKRKMKFIFRIIYYNIRNLTYYHQEREIAHSRFMDVATYGNDGRRALTDAVLATVGLKTVDNDKDAVPWYIILSTMQKSWVQQASDQGFKVGLI